MAKHHQYTVMDERQLAMPRAMARKISPPYRRSKALRNQERAQRVARLQQASEASRLRMLNKAVVRQAEIQRRSQP